MPWPGVLHPLVNEVWPALHPDPYQGLVHTGP
jgi:hypothetical protein